jgi:hypothetical protein
MVSDEGACRIWWASGMRQNVSTGEQQAKTEKAIA